MDLDQLLPLLAHGSPAPLDLAEVALRLAREEYADLDVEATLAELDGMAHDVRPRLRGSLEARVRGLGRYLFHELGFRGNVQHYYDPRNSYFNQVLDRRVGVPISLSLVAMAVGQRAGLHVVGVGLPGHFVAKAVEGNEEVCFDPFHCGRLLTPRACEELVEQVTGNRFRATASALAEASAHAIVVRILTNLKGIYLKSGEFQRAARVLHRLCQLLPGDPYQWRDLGASLLHAGHPGQALEPLDAYLKAFPDATDGDAVKHLLQNARRELARWN
jgi:regulator of sirC expression with transglutaminase-like and TPR domain